MRISKIIILKMKGQRRKKENSYTKQIEGTEVNNHHFFKFFRSVNANICSYFCSGLNCEINCVHTLQD